MNLKKFLTIKFCSKILLLLILFLVILGLFIRYKKINYILTHAEDVIPYSYMKFYSIANENRLIFDLALEDLNKKNLNKDDKKKLEKICNFHIEEGVERLEVAKGYDCLLRLYANDNSTLVEKYKAIKNGSHGLEALYTKNAALNLAKLIITGHEKEVKELLSLENSEDFLKYFTGYASSEILFLKKLISLNIPELTAKSLYRLSLIHILGRSSFNEEALPPNFILAAKEAEQVIKLTKIKQDNMFDIALTINDKFAEHAAVVIASALLNSDLNSFYRFHIIMDPNDPVLPESQEKLATMKYIKDYSIDFTSFPENLIDKHLIQKKLKFSSSWPLLVLYRLYLDQIFPKLNSILYLDSDIVILQDLTSLKKINMEDYIAAGVIDNGLVHGTGVQYECNKSINVFYKNGGIMFFNLENLKKKKEKEKEFLLKILNKSKCNFFFLDQDLFNIAFHNYIYPLSIRWNFSTYFDNVSLYFSNFILHYAGPQKPWDKKIKELWKSDPNKLSENVKNYWRYRELTPWKN
ncbi:glycosyltransferase family 8 protein [Rickettsia endosymbiont of Halotydeus destructor]